MHQLNLCWVIGKEKLEPCSLWYKGYPQHPGHEHGSFDQGQGQSVFVLMILVKLFTSMFTLGRNMFITCKDSLAGAFWK